MIEEILDTIEQNRSIIGLTLIGLIIFGGVLLLRPQKTSPALSSQNPNDQRIAELEKSVNQLTDRINELSKIQSVAQNPVAVEADTGKVAGVETSKVVAAAENITKSNQSAQTATNITGKININTATATALSTLPGIGDVYAQRIIDYRQEHGPFTNIETLKQVKGIGDKTFEKFKDKITI